jgi:hypothetical protein
MIPQGGRPATGSSAAPAAQRSARLALWLPALLALAGCSTAYSYPPVGTGWSRAPDLSVYAALNQAAQLAREQEVLCEGENPDLFERRWQAEFAARHDWIASAMAARYGPAALAGSTRRLTGREPCPEVPDDRWRNHYSRLLHLLELRLYPKDHWSA